jgi:hypothetical protein
MAAATSRSRSGPQWLGGGWRCDACRFAVLESARDAGPEVENTAPRRGHPHVSCGPSAQELGVRERKIRASCPSLGENGLIGPYAGRRADEVWLGMRGGVQAARQAVCRASR